MKYKILIILIILFIINISIFAPLLNNYKVIIKSIPKKYDIIENILNNKLHKLSTYFDKNNIVYILKIYNEYNKNKKIYNKIKNIQYRYFVLLFCTNNPVPVKLVYSCFQWESGWLNKVIGRNKTSYDIGICQLNSRYLLYHAKRFFRSENLNKFNPKIALHNLEVGLGLLNNLYIICDFNYKKCLMSYNAGYYAVMVYNNIPDSTYEYVEHIENIMSRI